MEEYYRVSAEVDLGAIAHNIKAIKKRIPEECELMAVVKADAYGHGVYGICDTLVENQVDRLAVAIIDEGIQLRKMGVHLPILILGYTPEIYNERIVKYDLIQTVFTYEMARSLSKAACKLNKTVKIHIKLDTGMGRIGFQCGKKALEEIANISQLPKLEIEGVFTHFARADEEDQRFTEQQLDMFIDFVQALEERQIHIRIKHAANSAAIIELPGAHFNMVRAGLIVYGLYPSDQVHQDRLVLTPAMTLKTHVIFTKEVEKGTPISYGSTYRTPCKKRIATIPVGYGDGYPRSLSSKGGVLIGGEFAPILGRICMDQFMVDISHIKNVQVGDEVILFGKMGKKELTVEDIASLIGTINYEVVCMLSKRVPRVYVEKS